MNCCEQNGREGVVQVPVQPGDAEFGRPRDPDAAGRWAAGRSRIGGRLLLAAGGVLLLHVISTYNYLLFHTLAEMASTVIAFGILMMAWPARRFIDRDGLLFLGFAYAAVGTIDLVHTLTYKGLGIFPGAEANIPTQLWIAARYVESIALFLTPSFMGGGKLPWRTAAAAVVTAAAVSIAIIMATDWFPDCYVEGVGLTVFKRSSEYVIAGIVCAAIARFWHHRSLFDPLLFRFLVASLVLTVLAELAFTAYVSVYGPANEVGHLLKFVSFLFIYWGVIENGLARPYEVMFQDLAASRKMVHRRNRDLEGELAHRAATEANLRRINADMEEAREQALQKLRAANDARRSMVRRVSAAALNQADIVQEMARLARARDEMRQENEVLRDQLQYYLQMVEQARDGIDEILTDEPPRIS